MKIKQLVISFDDNDVIGEEIIKLLAGHGIDTKCEVEEKCEKEEQIDNKEDESEDENNHKLFDTVYESSERFLSGGRFCDFNSSGARFVNIINPYKYKRYNNKLNTTSWVAVVYSEFSGESRVLRVQDNTYKILDRMNTLNGVARNQIIYSPSMSKGSCDWKINSVFKCTTDPQVSNIQFYLGRVLKQHSVTGVKGAFKVKPEVIEDLLKEYFENDLNITKIRK